MKITPYLNFKGDCLKALKFYADVFEAKITQIQQYKDMPANPDFPIAEEQKEFVLHATLDFGEASLMFADSFEKSSEPISNNINLAIGFDSEEQLKGAFEKLKTAGTVIMELQETFFSKLYAQVTDQYHVTWQLTLN